MLRLTYDRGTLLLDGSTDERREAAELCPAFRVDGRVGRQRAEGFQYRAVVTALTRAGIPFEDAARGYAELTLEHLAERAPFPHQAEALAAWEKRGRRGVVVLPTGSGKTYVAEMAILRTGRSTLVVAPTIDLMNQWYDRLVTAFGDGAAGAGPGPGIGVVGGGLHDVADITVTTYDSAFRQLEPFGARFGLVVWDEVHHLPGPSYALSAEAAIAPFRLGLTATPERTDGREDVIEALVGPIVYRRDVGDLAGEVLAPYETVRLTVRLSPEEAARYGEARETYLGFLRDHGLRLTGAQGWQRFIQASCRSREGRRAFRAWHEQRTLALGCAAKRELLARLLRQHRRDRTLVFTHDNATAYAISRTHLVPAITHQTDAKERRWILQSFARGDVMTVVTSRVLNEGVDVPSANVAVVMSGSASVREHVQRLGRILRRAEGKEAVLYEIVAEGTAEEGMSERRRDHAAYRALGSDPPT